MMYLLVRDLAKRDAPLRVPAVVACRCSAFPSRANVHGCATRVSDRDWTGAHLVNTAFDAHADDPTFGYRLIRDEPAALGFTASERQVWRVCSQERLWSVHAKKKGKNRKAGPPAHDDRVKRYLTEDEPKRSG